MYCLHPGVFSSALEQPSVVHMSVWICFAFYGDTSCGSAAAIAVSDDVLISMERRRSFDVDGFDMVTSRLRVLFFYYLL